MAEAVFTIYAAEAILKQLLSLATNQINNQINVVWGFKQGLRKLCKMLETIQALLHDAGKKEITSATMVVWLKDLRDATCDAENVLDELAYEALRRNVQNRVSNKVSDLFTLSNPLLFRVKMASKVNDINIVLDNICERANKIGLTPAKQINDAIESGVFTRTLPCIGGTQVVGRDGDIKKVVDMLLGNDVGCDLLFIAIVGMAGVGKTMVARAIYKQPTVLENFCGISDNRMWICVSDNFNIKRLLNEMVESLTSIRSDIENEEGLLKKLKEKLNGKKYLLVLDDVWNTNPYLWEDLKNSLIEIGGSKESKILVTTRSMDVVSAMRASPSYTHQLMQLSDSDCFTMFREKVFDIGGPRETQTLLDVGRRMVGKCKGVPLAVNALGGLLYSKHDEHEWESIENSELWSVLAKVDGILPILKLSVDHLPSPSLKSSFAYCSIFSKDQVIIKDDLIQLWMGLGYLQPSLRSKEEMEELGNEYFVMLWHNSLFQELKFDKYYNNVKSCKMHDLVHDLALDISQGTCYTSTDSRVKINPDVQHLSSLYSGETRLDVPEENVGRLRTLFLKGDFPKNAKDFDCIRALRLENSELPTLKCCKSIHLRFLDISKSSIKKVPNFVAKLYNLETLKLPWTVEVLPKDFHNMVSLRHFYLEDRERDIPIVEWRLRYLKGKDQHRKLMPMKIGLLTSLHTLPFFFVGEKSGHRIEELGSLNKLRGNLHVYDLQHVKGKEEAEKAQISGKSKIQELQFHWDENLKESNNHGDVLEGLKPNRNLKGLILTNFGGRRWVSWMSREAQSLEKLVKIELMDCKLLEHVPALGHLPHLEFIVMSGLHSLKHIGPEFYGHDEWSIDSCGSSEAEAPIVFPTLSEVQLHNMPQLEKWSEATNTMHSFPSLKIISIEECPKLTTIPAFKVSTYLRKLSISSCVELTCLPEGILQPTLVAIDILDCPKLKTLNSIGETEAAFNGSMSLQRLWIHDCPELTCLPKGLLQPTLGCLSLHECPKLGIANADALRSLTSLHILQIDYCPNWVSFWEQGLVSTTNLNVLGIGGFGEEYRYFPWPSTCVASETSRNFTSLKCLYLYGWPEVKSLPDQVEHLPALKLLEISNFSRLESLPEWLRKFSSLQCLTIDESPLLGKRCEKDSGEDWCKIAHIPCIVVDGRTIQDVKCNRSMFTESEGSPSRITMFLQRWP